MSTRATKGSTAALIAATVSLLSIGWMQQQQVVPGRTNVPVPIPQDSIEHGVTCGPVEGDRRANIPDSAVSWATWEIPEYQDRQAFVRRTDGQYGPVACIVAADRIDTFTVGHFTRPQGALVGVVFVDGDPAGDASYLNLRLSRGYHCVFLKLNQSGPRGSSAGGYDQVRFDRTRANGENGPTTATGWRGYIVPSPDRTCAFDSTKTLRGHRVIPVDMSPAEIPAAARFMLKRDGTAGIGIRCLDAWCVLGLRQAEVEPIVHSVPTGGPEKAKRLVFGWYDDQVLAVPLAGAAGIHAGGPELRATIIPDTGLSHYRIDPDFRNWTQVAKVRFTGKPTGKYKDVWHFLPRQDNTIKLKHVAPWGRESWQVMINDTIRDGLRVRWTPHGTSAFLASTARWAWKKTDEGGWIRCDDGCCEIQPAGVGFGM